MNEGLRLKVGWKRPDSRPNGGDIILSPPPPAAFCRSLHRRPNNNTLQDQRDTPLSVGCSSSSPAGYTDFLGNAVRDPRGTLSMQQHRTDRAISQGATNVPHIQ